jgi:hypothetical protein
MAIVLGLFVAATYAIGSRSNEERPALPPPTGPAGNGLVAYDSGGDIHLGDPVTGLTRAITRGPEIDSRPIFSPDGTRIAFVRGERDDPFADSRCRPATERCDTRVIVVRADGSDERIVVPATFLETGLVGFSWTPDGASIIVNHDARGGPAGGYLTLFHATGVSEPLPLTPPLPRWPGGYHPQIGGEVAPMFRPPTGDRLLSFPGPGETHGGTSDLVEMDIDGSDVRQLVEPLEADLPFRMIAGAVWSPDARWIALTTGDQACPGWSGACMVEVEWRDQKVYVMDADGGQVRRLSHAPADVDPGRQIKEGWPVLWSPDGSRILIDRTTAEYLDISALDTQTFPTSGQTIVVEVATGAERAITPPTPGTYGPPYGPPAVEEPPAYTTTVAWSPDGRSVLVFEGPGTRPCVVDIETGTTTTLPWEAESHPSWQRVTDG